VLPAWAECLLVDGELEHVTPSPDVAKRLLENAEAHIGLADKGTEDDPAGALQLSYDAARKASAALLAIQGLRSTTNASPSLPAPTSRTPDSRPPGESPGVPRTPLGLAVRCSSR
jgi:hypothetical protein